MRTVRRHHRVIWSHRHFIYLQTIQMIPIISLCYIFQIIIMSVFNSIFKKNEKEKEKERDRVKQQQIAFYQEEKLQLPPHFAQTVMELQMQLEFVQTYNMELIQQLNQLYRIAIQYYINEDPRKANHFQKKLTSLLTHPHTLELIEKKPLPAKQSQVDSAQYTSHLRMELNKFNTQSQIVIRSMIEGSNKKVEKSNRLMSDNIFSQEQMLNKRLEERSRSKKKLQRMQK